MKVSGTWQGTSRRRIFLMRHGDVSYFDADGRPYYPATVPLNAEGLAQAEAAAQALAKVTFDRAVTSSLRRCVETASVVSAGRGLNTEIRTELREIEPGRLADIPAEDVERTFLMAFGKRLSLESRFLAGETFGSLIERVSKCLDDLLADSTWRQLLIVAHGGVNRVILCRALEIGLGSFGVLEQDPACINVLDVDDSGNWIVRLMNFTPWNTAKQGLQATTMERLYVQYQTRRSSTLEAR